MFTILQFFIIGYIFFKLDSFNYYNDIKLKKFHKITTNLDDTVSQYSHIIVNDKYFYKGILLTKDTQYIFSTKNLNVEGTFLGSNDDMLFIANQSYLFKIELCDITYITEKSEV